jgi:hypothetical protein
MSVLTAVRSAARHRAKSPAQLREELDQANASLDELGRAYLTVISQLDQAGIDLSGALEDLRVSHGRNTELCVANEELSEENRELTARLANLDPYRNLAIGTRDVDPGDSPTEPIDVRALRTEHGGDYLNRTGEAWRGPITVVPLWRAPFAVIPTRTELVMDAPPPSLADRFAAGGHVITLAGGAYRTAT